MFDIFIEMNFSTSNYEGDDKMRRIGTRIEECTRILEYENENENENKLN